MTKLVFILKSEGDDVGGDLMTVGEATKHADKPGAGAKKRKKLRGKAKVEAVMKEFKAGTLRSSSGEVVTDRKQAIAIAMSEAGLSYKK